VGYGFSKQEQERIEEKKNRGVELVRRSVLRSFLDGILAALVIRKLSRDHEVLGSLLHWAQMNTDAELYSKSERIVDP